MSPEKSIHVNYNEAHAKSLPVFFIRIKVSLHDTFLHGESSAEVVQNK